MALDKVRGGGLATGVGDTHQLNPRLTKVPWPPSQIPMRVDRLDQTIAAHRGAHMPAPDPEK